MKPLQCEKWTVANVGRSKLVNGLLKHGSSELRVIVIYRIPYSAAHPISTSVFLDEFPAYLESVVMS